jgi:hypothetical protein
MSSSSVHKSSLPLKYLSMGHCLISIKISQCTLCFVCSFVGLICIPSAKFGLYVDASEGWLVGWLTGLFTEIVVLLSYMEEKPNSNLAYMRMLQEVVG